jgi:hypothetical protein
MIMLVRDIVVMAGRSCPLMCDNGDRYSLGAIRELGLDLDLGLRWRSRSAGSDGVCRCDARKAGERQHHHSHK